MLKVYGSIQCPDCVECKKALDDASVEYEYLDFADSLLNLKLFLSIRDNHPLFEDVKREGKIGIPCLVDDTGAVSLDWDNYVSQDKA